MFKGQAECALMSMKSRESIKSSYENVGKNGKNETGQAMCDFKRQLYFDIINRLRYHSKTIKLKLNQINSHTFARPNNHIRRV